MKPRVPRSLINKLHAVIEKLERGPCCSHIGFRSLTPEEALEEAHNLERNWRKSWITPELRQLLSYLEGKHTVREIEAFEEGYTYREGEEK